MPEHLKTLVVILALASMAIGFARQPVYAMGIQATDFRRRYGMWLAMTLIAFLSHNFWIYMILAGGTLLLSGSGEKNKLALYYFLLFAVPSIGSEISGFGGIRYFFEIDYLRLLSLTILLPAALSLQTEEKRAAERMPAAFKFLLAYLVLNLLLQLNVDTFTNTLRKAFLFFIDIVLPFYVASRALNNLKDIRDALASLSVAAMILGAIAIFEFARHWLLYTPLETALGVSWGYGNYLERDETLRALGSTGQPIALGFVMAIAIGIYLYLYRLITQPFIRVIGLTVLVAGLIASLSRGPWIGAAVILLVFVTTGPRAVPRLLLSSLVAGVVLMILLQTPMGEKIVSYLPFVGDVEMETITYRQRLIEVSLAIIMENPLFGSYDFMLFLEEMRQGQGIIDIVNSYLSIALSSGLVGLTLFLSIFGSVILGIMKAMRGLVSSNELHLLGRSLLATIVGMLVIIFTVSSITVIPVIYWSIAGIGLAYIRHVRSLHETKTTRVLQR